MKDRVIELILAILERLARALGFGLVPIEDAEILDDLPIGFTVP